MMMEQTDRIIHRIYESAASPESWEDTACAIGDLLGAGSVHMMLTSLETGRDYVNLMARGNPNFAADYLENVAPIDFRVPRVLAHRPGVYIDERSYVTRDEARLSPIHQEYLPREGIFNISGANMSHDGCIGWFGLSTLGPDHEFDDRQRAFLAHVSAHVFTAFRLTRTLQDLTLQRDLSMHALSGVNSAILLVAGGRVIEGNAAFHRLLASGFFTLRNDMLSCTDAAQAARLAAYLASEADTEDDDCLVLRHRDAGASYLVQCRSLFSRMAGVRRSRDHKTVSILELNLEEDPALEEVSAFAAGYGVSPAEAMVLHAVLCSRPLGEFAQVRGVRLDTVRKQLKSALQKTGLNSQKKLFQAFERYRLLSPGPGEAAPTLTSL